MTVSLATAGTHTTGTLTSTGLGSGLDINTMVTAIVNAAIQPQQTLLQANQAADQTTISALGAVKSALSSLQTAVDAISTGGALSQLSAKSSDSTVFTASAGSGAVAGSYQVQVQTLAQANSIKSTAFGSASAAVTDGTYGITAGGKTFNVTVDSSNDTLSGLAAAINGASDNSGVSATVINSSSGSYLLLSATQTGTANAVSVSAPISFSTVQPAADATGTIAGLPFDSASNVVSDVLTGVSLSLASASPNTTQTLTVSANAQSAANAVQSFVSAYNAAVSLLGSDTAYTPGSGSGSSATAGSAGPLLGNVAISGLMYRLQSIVAGGNGAGSGFTSLSQIGLSVNTDGSLSVNSATLSAALQSNAAGVKSLFTGSGGIGTQLDSLLSNVVGAGGSIDSQTTVLQTQIGDITSKLNDLTTRQSQLTQQYFAQFNAMDSVVAAYKNTSSLLTQLYAPRAVNSSGSGG